MTAKQERARLARATHDAHVKHVEQERAKLAQLVRDLHAKQDEQDVWSINDLEDAGLPTTCAICGSDLMDDVDWGFLGEDRVPTHLFCFIRPGTLANRRPNASASNADAPQPRR